MKAIDSREEIRARIKSTGCVICGFNDSQRALHFHHKHGGGKNRSPSIVLHNSTKETGEAHGIYAFAAEVVKCILVCANCHAMIHDGKIDVETYPTIDGTSVLSVIEEIKAQAKANQVKANQGRRGKTTKRRLS